MYKSRIFQTDCRERDDFNETLLEITLISEGRKRITDEAFQDILRRQNNKRTKLRKEI